jgi:hypothetical protein
MKEERKQRIKSVLMISLTMLLLFGKPEALAEGEYLIVRVVDVDYPPSAYIFTDGNYTGFTFRFYLEEENPSQSIINITYSCSPTPFPHLRANLEDKNLDTVMSTQYEWGGWQNYSKPPGITERSHPSSIIVFDYQKNHLPLGEYEIWFDYTNCSYTYVPVITYSLIITVTKESTTYFFEYNNETKIDYTSPTIESSYFSLVQTSAVIALVSIALRIRMKKIRKL